MSVEHADTCVSRIAGAIAEPARTRMLFSLMDGHARTSTELAVVAEVAASTASVHLARLLQQQLVTVLAQGKHRYYRLEGPEVAAALEALSVVAGHSREPFVPSTPSRLRVARTCYDHMAGTVAVALHDRLVERRWLSPDAAIKSAYQLTKDGVKGFAALGVNVDETRKLRRRFACACLDWSERRPHLGGALGSALLQTAIRRKWIERDLDSRAIAITRTGRREMRARFGLPD